MRFTKKDIRLFFETGFVMFCAGALMMAGMIAIEWVIPRPEREYYVCVIEDDGSHCDEYIQVSETKFGDKP
jgi:hypothetical protein